MKKKNMKQLERSNESSKALHKIAMRDFNQAAPSFCGPPMLPYWSEGVSGAHPAKPAAIACKTQ